jgi:Flp pilus assembly protein TadB
MTLISKETGIKVAKGVAFIVTPTIIILVVLAFLWWRKKKNKKTLQKEIEEAASDVKPKTEENA